MKNTLTDLYQKISNDSGKPPSTLRVEGIVSNIQVQNDGQVEITLLMDEYPHCDAICQTEELFETLLGVSEVRFCIHTTEIHELDVLQYLPWAFRHLEKIDFLLASFMKTAVFHIIADKTVMLSVHEGCEEVLGKGADHFLTGFFQQTTRQTFDFLQQACSLNIQDAMQTSMKEMSDLANRSRETMEPAFRSKPKGEKNEKRGDSGKKAADRRDDPGSPAKLGVNPKNTAIPTAITDKSKQKKIDYKELKQPSGVIWGKMNSELALTAMNTFTNETGHTTMEGAVFGMESRIVSNGTKVLVKFCLTDQTNSIRCFAFMKPEEASDFEENHKKSHLRLCAEVGYDSQYEKDLVARVIGIQIATPPKKRTDTAEVKRVELHCHSKMSARDSVCDVAEIVHLAAQYGHDAVAITDHGVVQAFPDARVAQLDAKKRGKTIKIIYGLECYLLEDGPCVAYQCNPESLDNGFVAIHLETTGTDPSADRIARICAVLFEKNSQGRFIPVKEFYRTLGMEDNVSPGVEKRRPEPDFFQP